MKSRSEIIEEYYTTQMDKHKASYCPTTQNAKYIGFQRTTTFDVSSSPSTPASASVLPMLAAGKEELHSTLKSKLLSSLGDKRLNDADVSNDKDLSPNKKRRKGHWDMKQEVNINSDEKQPVSSAAEREQKKKVGEKQQEAIDSSLGDNNNNDAAVNDALDAFMMGLDPEPLGDDNNTVITGRNINSSGSMMRTWKESFKKKSSYSNI